MVKFNKKTPSGLTCFFGSSCTVALLVALCCIYFDDNLLTTSKSGVVSLSAEAVKSTTPSSWGNQKCGGADLNPFQSAPPCIDNKLSDLNQLPESSEALDELGRKTSVSLTSRMLAILDKGVEAKDYDLETYVSLSKRCRNLVEAAPHIDTGCNTASLDVSDAKFLKITTEMASGGNVSAQQALGSWWYLTAEDLFSRGFSNVAAALPLDQGGTRALDAEMLAFRLATPAFSEAVDKSAGYLRQAKDKGYSDASYLDTMTSNGWVR